MNIGYGFDKGLKAVAEGFRGGFIEGPAPAETIACTKELVEWTGA